MFGRKLLEIMSIGQPNDHDLFTSIKDFVCVQGRARPVSMIISASGRREIFQSNLAGKPIRTAGVRI